MKKILLIITIFSIFIPSSFCKLGIIEGQVISQKDSLPVSDVLVFCSDVTMGVRTDEEGYFKFNNPIGTTSDLTIDCSVPIKNKEYHTVYIKDISLTKEIPDVNLGKIVLVEKETINSVEELPWLIIDKNKYCYSFSTFDGETFYDFFIVDLRYPNIPGRIYDPNNYENSMPSITDNRFEGGTIELLKRVSRELGYPSDAVDNAIVGLSLASCTINPDGTVHNVAIINPLCQSIDSKTKQALRSLDGEFKSINKDSLETFYIQILYELPGLEFFTSTLKYENVLDPVTISVKMMTFKGDYEKTDEYIAAQINNALKNEDYSIAVEFLNEAIRRNPYVPELYQLRILAHSKLGRKNATMEDALKIANFMDGKSLESIIAEKSL